MRVKPFEEARPRKISLIDFVNTRFRYTYSLTQPARKQAMDFARQCRRLNNFRVLNEENFKCPLNDISAMSVMKSVQKVGSTMTTMYKIIIADNGQQSLFVLNEADGQLVKELRVDYLTYGVCCHSQAQPAANKPNVSFVYVSDYTHNKVLKYDENLKLVKELVPPANTLQFNRPCQIAINTDLEQIQVVDQKNCRIVFFDLKNDEYESDFKLFQDDLAKATKFPLPNRMDLSADMSIEEYHDLVRERVSLEFWPFGLYTKNERLFVTDWNRSSLYVYKNHKLEKKFGGLDKRLMCKPRDMLLDSLDSIMIADNDRESLVVLDHKGVPLFETKLPRIKTSKRALMTKNGSMVEPGIFGINRIEHNKLLVATNSHVIICHLAN